MKYLTVSVTSLMLSIALVAAGRYSGRQHVTKQYWKLRAGMSYINALTPTAYTLASYSSCPGALDFCGIYAAPSVNNAFLPDLNRDALLKDDLDNIHNGIDPQSNVSGEVFFQDM